MYAENSAEDVPCQANRSQIFTVTSLSRLIKGCIEENFPAVQVEGEVSMPKLHSSGHLYLTLKDEQAVLDVVCWRPLASRLKDILSHGARVVCRGKVTSYPGRSKYQMVLVGAEPAGQGDLFRILEERRKRLAAEGLFAEERKKPLPPFPRCIGVITSPTGAVIQDILHRLEERFPTKVLLCPTTVQGERAVTEIVSALQTLGTLRQNVDVIILARGGGSFEDLFVFHDEAIVRAIAACEVPVISAIGHETDTTLADFVADKRAPTPTAAAEIATPHREALYEGVEGYEQRFTRGWQKLYEMWAWRLKVLAQNASREPALLAFYAQKLDMIEDRLQRTPQKFQQYEASLEALIARLKTPALIWQMQQEKVLQAQKCLHLAIKKGFTKIEEQLSTLSGRLQMASHKKTLERGFCLAVTEGGQVIRSINQVKKASALSLQFHDGDVTVKPVS